MGPRYRREGWLFEHYHEKGWTQQEMADACDVSPRTIRDWMKRHDIETRNLEGENHPLYGKERDEAVKEQISATMEGREFSETTRQKMAEAHQGQGIPTDIKEKISNALSGRQNRK
jgi:transposase-like protein